ncbi:MAG: exo-alpha-sialidase [Ruminococcaceae bacterium]|nr:exo-alpha-sialidase [Oscillospiraceae bacterium]
MSQYVIKTNGIDDAAARPCQVLYRPADPIYAESIRQFQGCPTVAVTRGGRVYAGWYSGGIREPHIDNYNLVVVSDDGGKTFDKSPLLVIPSDRKRLVQALDIQMWIAPDGALHIFWVQNDVTIPEDETRDNFDPEHCRFADHRHTEWVITCADPDADEPQFSEPRLLDIGFLRCKPLVTDTGRWINFNYDQTCDRYGYSISDDQGKTWTRHYGAKKLATPFDEGMAYQKRDGSIRMLARCTAGELAETTSRDNGITWEAAKLSGIDSPSSRLYVSRTPTGNVLLVCNDHRGKRCRMTVKLSVDDGETWPYSVCVDERDGLSYPDADFHDGKIYLTYDRERTGAMEILFTVFTEDDVMRGTIPAPYIISKP